MRIIALVITIAIIFSGCREDFSELVFYNSIQGEVLDFETQEPLADVRITTNPVTKSFITDENGLFRIDSLTKEIYTLTSFKDGYEKQISTVNLGELQDDVQIFLSKDSIILPRPNEASNPMPASGSEEISLDVTLSWSGNAGSEKQTYDVYLIHPETQESVMILSDSDSTKVELTGLEFNITYLWQVCSKNEDNDKTFSPVWNFKTIEFPDESFRYTFVRNIEGKNQIFIGNEDREEIQLTYEESDLYRPLLSPNGNEIAFIKNVNGEYQLFTMSKNGDNISQVTDSKPLRTKDINEVTFTWIDEGARLAFMDFDELHTISKDGSGLTQIPFQSNGEIITSIDYSAFDGGKYLLSTETTSSRLSKIYEYSLDSNLQVQLLDSITGLFSQLQYSPDGNNILFSFNPADKFSSQDVPLDRNLYIYNSSTGEWDVITTEKASGTGDSNGRYSENGDIVAFTNNKSDNSGTPIIYTLDIKNSDLQRDTLFVNANMVDWK